VSFLDLNLPITVKIEPVQIPSNIELTTFYSIQKTDYLISKFTESIFHKKIKNIDDQPFDYKVFWMDDDYNTFELISEDCELFNFYNFEDFEEDIYPINNIEESDEDEMFDCVSRIEDNYSSRFFIDYQTFYLSLNFIILAIRQITFL